MQINPHINLLSPPTWPDYELLDSGNGRRLERFGKFILSRPDPQTIWPQSLSTKEWAKADATFHTKWQVKRPIPDRWLLSWKNLSFYAKLTPFKHTGIFPEQSVHWQFIKEALNRPETGSNPARVLNLFGYTGIATLAAASAGAQVTHVDSSFPTIGWARDNQTASNFSTAPIRWIQDDCLKFCQRELKRGSRYDALIMDPPSFGHGPQGQVWRFNDHFPKLLDTATQLLNPTPLFIIINAYAISSSSITLGNILAHHTHDLRGQIEFGELCLNSSHSPFILSTNIFARWSK